MLVLKAYSCKSCMFKSWKSCRGEHLPWIEQDKDTELFLPSDSPAGYSNTLKHPLLGRKIQTWTVPNTSELFLQFLAWFSKDWCYNVPAPPPAIGTSSLLETFSQTWGNTMVMWRRQWWIHTSEGIWKGEGKESSSLLEFLDRRKASV